MKKQYKKNSKYTSEYENLNDTILIGFYRTYTRDKQIEIEEYFLNRYGNYINKEIKNLKEYFNKQYNNDYGEYMFEDYDYYNLSEIYQYLLHGLNKYKLNSNMSFKSYIITTIEYDIMSIATKIKKEKEKEENGEYIVKKVELGTTEDGEQVYENIGNIKEELNTYSSVDLLVEIKEFIDTLGERGRLFADSIFTENDKGNIGLKLRELEEKYGISKERCRQIIEEVRDIIKIKYNIHLEDGNFIL